MPQFTPNGCIATPSLISALIKENNGWSKAVLGQCFCIPADIQKRLLSGELEWQTPNEKTLIITLPESQ